MSTQELVASTIRAELARRNLTQVQLAAVLGKSPQVINKQLRGRQDFRLSELVAISEFLNIDLDLLVKIPVGVK